VSAFPTIGQRVFDTITSRAQPELGHPADEGQTRRRERSLGGRDGLGSPAEIALAAVGVCVLAVAVGRMILDANRGIDITDEGMYLLSADAPSSTALFHAPFGRYTGILYRGVGWDIARFRALGIVLLVGAAVVLGRVVVRTADRLRGRETTIAGSIAATCGTVGGALSGYTLYLLTPNYNWINLLGLLLAAAGGLALAVPGSSHARADRFVWPVAVAAGAIIATSGKPSSGPVILGATIGLIMLVRPGGWPSRWSAVGRIVAAVLVLLALHFLFVNTPGETVDMVRRGLEALRILDPASYELSQALDSVRDAVVELPGNLTRSTGGVLLAVLASLVVLSFRRSSEEELAMTGLVTTGAIAVSLAVNRVWIGGGAGYRVLAGTGATFVLVTAALVCTRWNVLRRRASTGGSHAVVAAVVGFLVLLAAAYAFGSGNGFWLQLNGSLALSYSAAIVLAFLLDIPRRVPTAGLMAVAMALGGAAIVDSARDVPYRTAPMDRQTVERQFGPHGSRMLLDRRTAAYLDEVGQLAAIAGFTPGTPMLDLTYYSAAVLYDLDALVPESLIPTVGSYYATNELARWSIGQVDPELWRSAWLLTAVGDPGAPDPSVLDALGRSFPDDYELVGEVDWWQRDERQQIWRPAQHD
jgi:hypothetical protein